MTNNKRLRLTSAHAAWSASPVQLSAASNQLAEISQSLVHTQGAMAPLIDAYIERGEIVPPPLGMAEWYRGMDYLIGRSLRSLRRMQQTGHQQVATRELLQQAITLKEAWDAYLAVTGL